MPSMTEQRRKPGVAARLEQLIPFALELSEAEVIAITAKGREKAFAAAYYGLRIMRGPAGPGETLLWVKGLVNVQPPPAVQP